MRSRLTSQLGQVWLSLSPPRKPPSCPGARVEFRDRVSTSRQYRLFVTSTSRPWRSTPVLRAEDDSRPVKGALDISHSQFLADAAPSSDFNPSQTPSAGLDTSSPWLGKLEPTTSHLFKLILPLPTSTEGFSKNPPSSHTPQPTAFLLHPSQPLSHLARLITGSLPPNHRNSEITFRAMTGPESDLDTHLRNAEDGDEGDDGPGADGGDDGGPLLGERRKDKGRLQEVSWSTSTDLSDFIKQACSNERFKIIISPDPDQVPEDGLILEVKIPSFASRTTYLRKRLLILTKDLDRMTKQKKQIDLTAHKGAQRLAIFALSVGAAYWVAVIRWTFFTDAGWDVMEPVTWSVGFGSLLASVAFLAYHNREVSYSSLLDLSITARQRRLYDQHGLDIEKWTEMVAEAKTIRREIARIAADYDIEWKGELENLARNAEVPKSSPVITQNPDKSIQSEESDEDESTDGDKKLDIDKTIDEASELASESEESKAKEKTAERKGETEGGRGEEGEGGKARRESVERGREKAEKLTKKGTS
ncbi:hypothetical protein BCR39DRAFT_488112 [Naematelia encephala]|uniref:Calcium uniporter protein, mitochondrial n=1 Tax=Naematelia encephala TaxID=71784 RepID=A0A1Y2AIY5_9TREE|nr:hypothetical protein BCR39DRAFT_488112 [Naematelia encephala]